LLTTWILAAFLLGTLAWRIGLPPLVGFLASGFLFGAIGAQPNELLDVLADAGVLLLLFAVGLKLRFRTLIRIEVWGSATAHLLIVAAVAWLSIALGTEFGIGVTIMAAIALSFSSTVLAAKVLESNYELRSVHGRIAIGVLIIQDIVAVAVLAAINGGAPSPWALLLFALPLLRPIAGWMLDAVGHDELLVLFGAVLAIVVGGTGFELLNLSPELGALVMGIMLAGHSRSQELSNALWGLKEFFLVGFFLSIGLSGTPTFDTLVSAAWLLFFIPFKAIVLCGLLIALGLRARTSFLTGLSLATYSEFGLIITSVAVDNGLLSADWLVVAAVLVAASFVIAAPLNTYAHEIYEHLAGLLERFERDTDHYDDEPETLGTSQILIVGMGRVGCGAYDHFQQLGEHVVGIDTDLGKIERSRAEGRRVVYADAEDASLWQQLNTDRLRLVMLALPDPHATCFAARTLRSCGYDGLISATFVYPEDQQPMLDAGCDVTYNYYTEAGVGFARDTAEVLAAAPER
jgi:predicted Kef-type K+ transport protein